MPVNMRGRLSGVPRYRLVWRLRSKGSSRLPDLPSDFLTRPIAHRGFHDVDAGVIENSRAAFEAAIDARFGIELDLQLSKDGEALVFHDYGLSRMTGEAGAVQMYDAGDLRRMILSGSDEVIPTFGEILSLVKGRVPLLVELKDQDGALGSNIGRLEKRVAEILDGYHGEVALISFNPHSIIEMRRLVPDILRGLVTEDFFKGRHLIPDARKQELTQIPHYELAGASFISHKWMHLASKPVKNIRNQGGHVLCWTIKSAKDEAAARQLADNVTFEGYNPDASA